MVGLFARFLNCSHPNWSWPITLNKKTYRVCTTCGEKRAYNWQKMIFTQPRKKVKKSLDKPRQAIVELKTQIEGAAR